MRRVTAAAAACFLLAGCAPASPASPKAAFSLRIRQVAPPLPAAVEGVRAAPYPGGALVVGGYTGIASLPNVWFYRPGHPVRLLARLPFPLHDAAVATVGNRLYVLGGGEFRVYQSAYAVAPNGTVASAGRLPAPLADATALSWQGNIVLAGGYDGGSAFPAGIRVGESPASLRTVAELPRGRRYAAAAIRGSDLYLFGGITPAGPTRSIWRIPLSGGAPRRVGRMPASYAYGAAFVLGGRLLVAGGELGGRPTAAVWQWVPGRGLRRLGSLPVPVADGAVAALSDHAVLLLGGRQGTGAPVAAVFEISMK